MVQVVLRESTSIFARLQSGETLLGRKRAELHSGSVAEDGCSNTAAEINVDTRPVTSIIRSGKAGEARGHAALDESLCLDVIQSCGGSRRGSHASNGSDANDSRQNLFVHLIQPFFLLPCFGCDKGGTSHLPGSQPYLLALEHTMPKCAMGQVFEWPKIVESNDSHDNFELGTKGGISHSDAAWLPLLKQIAARGAACRRFL
jgi:hypothetical protein